MTRRALFRLAIARTREIVRTEGEIARLEAKPERPPRRTQPISPAAKSSLEALRGRADRLQAQLADYPRYKVLAPQSVELAELQAALRPGEGYYKMMVVGDAVYATVRHPWHGARALRARARTAAHGDERRRAARHASSGSRMARR